MRYKKASLTRLKEVKRKIRNRLRTLKNNGWTFLPFHYYFNVSIQDGC